MVSLNRGVVNDEISTTVEHALPTGKRLTAKRPY
jgi:hypothetical protein